MQPDGNDYNIAYLISNLSKYPNVVTISVGNETSFFSKYMPLPCLENYIRDDPQPGDAAGHGRRRLDVLRRQDDSGAATGSRSSRTRSCR